MCGEDTSSRKQSLASAAISANGSRAISVGTSLRATATATSTASHSSLVSIACSASLALPRLTAMRSSASAMRRSASILASAWASAWPWRRAEASASASFIACSASVIEALPGLRSVPEAKSTSNRNFAGAPILIHQLFFAAALGDDDLALGGEVLGEIDQERLRLVDLAQPYRAHGLHVVHQHLGGARRHVGEEELAHRLGGALERDRELVLLDVAHQGLRRGGVELGQIVEREHQGLDAFGALAVVLFEGGDEAGFGLPIEIVEDLRHHLVRVAAARLRKIGHELGAQRLLDTLQNFFLHRFHAQHAVDDVERQLLGQDGEHARGMVRADFRQHDGDSLRIFVLEIVGEHLLLDVGELLPHVAAGGAAD